MMTKLFLIVCCLTLFNAALSDQSKHVETDEEQFTTLTDTVANDSSSSDSDSDERPSENTTEAIVEEMVTSTEPTEPIDETADLTNAEEEQTNASGAQEEYQNATDGGNLTQANLDGEEDKESVVYVVEAVEVGDSSKDFFGNITLEKLEEPEFQQKLYQVLKKVTSTMVESIRALFSGAADNLDNTTNDG